MSIYINPNGILIVHYAHGRYGSWKYTFRYQNEDFELIGYDESNGGAITESEVSINFSTKKKQIKKYPYGENEEHTNVVPSETWENIKINKLIKLSEIEEFFGLNFFDL